jgi:hypothetical protein
MMDKFTKHVGVTKSEAVKNSEFERFKQDRLIVALAKGKSGQELEQWYRKTFEQAKECGVRY